jgi:hypothetical protein
MNNTHTIHSKKTLLVRLIIISLVLCFTSLGVLFLRIYCENK